MVEQARKPWGSGRIALLARLDTIQAEIGQGLPLTAIFERHKAVLGIGYPSFVKLVGRYAGDARVTRRRSQQSSARPAAAAPAEQGSAPHARHARRAPSLAPAPTFTYDGNPRADDDSLIFGHKREG